MPRPSRLSEARKVTDCFIATPAGVVGSVVGADVAILPVSLRFVELSINAECVIGVIVERSAISGKCELHETGNINKLRQNIVAKNWHLFI